MLISLILVFLLYWFLTKDMRLKKKQERLHRSQRLESTTFIKFDETTVKVCGILTIVAFVCMIIFYIIAEYKDLTVVILLVLFQQTFLFFLVVWLLGLIYLKRLKEMGYEIPKHSKDYDYILEKVPRIETNTELKNDNKRSKIFSVIYGCIGLCMLEVNMWISFRWSDMGNIVIFLLLGYLDIYWFIRAWHHYKQMNNEKYKEEDEVDTSRRSRTHPVLVVTEMLLMLLIVCCIKKWYVNFMDYAYRSQLESDRVMMEYVHGMLDVIYRELMVPDESNLFTPEELAEDWSVSRQQLMEGVDITEWGEPQDIYQRTVAGYLGIDNFSELDNLFVVGKKDTVLIAKIEDEVLTLSLANMKRKADGPIIIKSQTSLPEE